MINCKQNTYAIIFALTLSSLNLLCMQPYLTTILSKSIGNYHFQAQKNVDYIVDNSNITLNDLENTDPMIHVLCNVMSPNILNEDAMVPVVSIRRDFYLYQSLSFTSLIHKLAQKTEQDSVKIAEFIHQQRAIYDRNGNKSKPVNFLRAFDDAKILFYCLPYKFKNNETCLTEEEHTFLIKNLNLINLLPVSLLPTDGKVTVKNQWLDRTRQAFVQTLSSGITVKATLVNLAAACSMHGVLDLCGSANNDENYLFLPPLVALANIMGVVCGCAAVDFVDLPLTKRIIIPFNPSNGQ